MDCAAATSRAQSERHVSNELGDQMFESKLAILFLVTLIVSGIAYFVHKCESELAILFLATLILSGISYFVHKLMF